MWTICWTSDQGDGWDRFDTREDVINLANTLVREGNAAPCDILIFPPEADEFSISYDVIED